MSNLSTFKTAALTFILSLVGFLGVYHVFHWGNVKKLLLVTIKSIFKILSILGDLGVDWPCKVYPLPYIYLDKIYYSKDMMLLILKRFTLLDPRPTEGSIKSPWCVRRSVYLSVYQFSIFLRNGSLDFSDFLHDG